MKTVDYSGWQMEKFLKKKVLQKKGDVDKKSEVKSRWPIYKENKE